MAQRLTTDGSSGALQEYDTSSSSDDSEYSDADEEAMAQPVDEVPVNFN